VKICNSLDIRYEAGKQLTSGIYLYQASIGEIKSKYKKNIAIEMTKNLKNFIKLKY